MYNYNCKLKRVVDGDTVDLEVDLGFDTWRLERVRLAGIDAPEVRTKDATEKAKGRRAAGYVFERLQCAEGIQLETTEYRRGKYGRVLGIVRYIAPGENRWRNMNDELIVNELAVAYGR